MNNKLLQLVLAALISSIVAINPAVAVTDGEMDGERHPYVGLMVADVNGTPTWRCSGSLITPRIFLTAGHCTDGATGARVWFNSDMTDEGTPDPTYPFGGEGSDAVEGTPYTHPNYDSNAFSRFDLGVVVLDNPVILDGGYAALPQRNQLDRLKTKRGLQDVTFTAVGYGLQQSFPNAAAWKDKATLIRMVAYPKLLQINAPGFTGSYSLLLSNNANTGGTCFGDSGGPNFIGNSSVIGGITSFGLNGTCAGTGGVYRLDRAEALDWLADNFSEYLLP